MLFSDFGLTALQCSLHLSPEIFVVNFYIILWLFDLKEALLQSQVSGYASSFLHLCKVGCQTASFYSFFPQEYQS